MVFVSVSVFRILSVFSFIIIIITKTTQHNQFKYNKKAHLPKKTEENYINKITMYKQTKQVCKSYNKMSSKM